MNRISVIEADDPRWTELISLSDNYDFYHTCAYHLLEKRGKPILLYYDLEGIFIAMPFIVREIPGSSYFDCTSAYGYCGPISNKAIDKIPSETVENFQKELLLFFKSNNIVTAFSRLHPLIENSNILHDIGVIREVNKTVAINLQLTPEEQRRQYRKSNKSEINQLRNKGFSVVEAKTSEEINRFIEVYYETMQRVSAGEDYFFDHDYFFSFLNNKDFKNKLLLAKKDEVVVAGAIFTITNKIMQYHLAGTTEEYIKVTPMKLILDEARLLGNKLGVDFLHLGGGVGGNDQDSLFKFKSGFSDYYCQYKVWELIVDEEKYASLNKLKGLTNSNANFFPLYRMT